MKETMVLVAAVLLAACGTGGQPMAATDDDVLEEAYQAGYDEGVADSDERWQERVDELEEQVQSLDRELAEALSTTGDDDASHDDAVDADASEQPDVEESIVVEVVHVYEPDEAWDLIRQANQFNDPPDDGMAYWMLRTSVTNNTDERITAWDIDWEAQGPENVVYREGMCGVLPEPELRDVAAIAPGGTQEGHICFVMREADAYATGERMLEAFSWQYDVHLVGAVARVDLD